MRLLRNHGLRRLVCAFSSNNNRVCKSAKDQANLECFWNNSEDIQLKGVENGKYISSLNNMIIWNEKWWDRQVYVLFTNVDNDLKSIRGAYLNSDLSNKILKTLPKSWEAKFTQYKKLIWILPLNYLFYSLTNHGMLIDTNQSKKKKRIVIKSNNREWRKAWW